MLLVKMVCVLASVSLIMMRGRVSAFRTSSSSSLLLRSVVTKSIQSIRPMISSSSLLASTSTSRKMNGLVSYRLTPLRMVSSGIYLFYINILSIHLPLIN